MPAPALTGLNPRRGQSGPWHVSSERGGQMQPWNGPIITGEAGGDGISPGGHAAGAAPVLFGQAGFEQPPVVIGWPHHAQFMRAT